MHHLTSVEKDCNCTCAYYILMAKAKILNVRMPAQVMWRIFEGSNYSVL